MNIRNKAVETSINENIFNESYDSDKIDNSKLSRSAVNKVSRESLFSENEKDVLWELFIKEFLTFEYYPKDSNFEEEAKSILKVIDIFEHWRTHIFPFKISLIDFSRTVEKFTFHSETQNYRMRSIIRYKEELRKVQEVGNADSGKSHKLELANSLVLNKEDNFLSENLIKEKLRLRREAALNRRKNLINIKS